MNLPNNKVPQTDMWGDCLECGRSLVEEAPSTRSAVGAAIVFIITALAFFLLGFAAAGGFSP